MKWIVLAVAVATAGCGSEEEDPVKCAGDGPYNWTPPTAEMDADCVPTTVSPGGPICVGQTAEYRLCWFACSGPAAAASGCAPDETCSDAETGPCTFKCPRGEPPCL